jgi:purine-binding chemotaxis protein CheW
MDAVLVPVGDDLYAVPIGWVREVVPRPPLTELVTAPATVLGLFNLRGEIVPLLDTAVMLALGRGGPVSFAVVLTTHLGPVGLSATAVPERTLLDDLMGPSELPGSAGRYRVGRRVAVLLDVEALLDAVAPTAHRADAAVAG